MNPAAIRLSARLSDTASIELDSSVCGLYRPLDFRAAPWSGFAYDQADNTEVGLAAGTRILTSRGEVEVERLLPGDNVLALRGPALLAIAWIGRTTPNESPVCIQVGALGPNLPRRTLCVAPDQPIFLQAAPVAARSLLNGTTVRTLDKDRVDMFHIDVGTSEILFVEGLPLSSGRRRPQDSP